MYTKTNTELGEIIKSSGTSYPRAYKEVEHLLVRRVLYSGDCVEKLTNGNDQYFLLDGFFTNVNEIKAFESNVAHITKAV